MNDEQIEKVLRKAPMPEAPAGLVEKLKGDIRLSQTEASTERSRIIRENSMPWIRRWLPALSFAAILAVCFVAMGMQGTVMSELQNKNAASRAKSQSLEELRQANATMQRLCRENQDADQLGKDNADMKRLREELASLTAQLGELQGLRDQNQTLKAQNAARGAEVAANIDAQRAEAESTMCINNMKQIGLAFRMWSNDHNDTYPNDFISMTNELSTWKILQCPADKSHLVSNWADVSSGNISYRRVSNGPGVDEAHPNIVLFECPVHGHVGLCDGSVQRGVPAIKDRLKVVDGVTYLAQ